MSSGVSPRTAGDLVTTFVIVIHLASLGYWCTATAPSVPGMLFLKEEGGISQACGDPERDTTRPPPSFWSLSTPAVSTLNWVKRLKVRWLSQCSRLSYFCYLNASLPLCVCMPWVCWLWFRAWSFLLIPFTKLSSILLITVQTQRDAARPHPCSWFFFFFFCILKML